MKRKTHKHIFSKGGLYIGTVKSRDYTNIKTASVLVGTIISLIVLSYFIATLSSPKIVI